MAPVAQRFRCHRRSIATIGSKKVGVAAQITHTGREGGDRQIPADHNRDVAGFPGSQGEREGDRCTGLLTRTAGAVVVAVGNAALRSERLPELLAIARGVPAAAAHYFNALQRVRHRQTPLPLPLADGLTALALQHDAAHTLLIQPTVALSFALADRRRVVVLRAAVVAEVHLCRGVGVEKPSHGVAPSQQQRQIQRLIGGIVQGPAEHGHRITGALVVAWKNRAEGLAAHLGVVHALITGPAQGIAGGIGAGAALRRAGGIPIPGSQGLTAVGA